jgi:CRP/FNR family transcriptional regulator, cyclic AMP receptor protein
VDKTELQTRLAGIDLFQDLPKRALRQVVNAGRETSHVDGREVITEGTGAVGFHLITSGQARVTSDGAVRRTLGVGDYFGEISAIDGQPRSASVEAVGELHTFLVNPHVLKTVLDENPAVARRLLIVLCKRLREAEQRTT